MGNGKIFVTLQIQQIIRWAEVIMKNLNGFIIDGSCLIKYTGDEKDIIIPEGIKTISISAFDEYRDIIENITLPNSLDKISYEFVGLEKLKSVNIPQNLKCINISSFEKCESLEKIVVPKNIESIFDYAFRDCTGLESVTVMGDDVDIGSGVFSGCSKLKSIVLEGNHIKVKSGILNGCDNLEELDIGGRVEGTIKNMPEHLKYLYMPETVVTVFSSVEDKCRAAIQFIHLSEAGKYYNKDVAAANKKYISRQKKNIFFTSGRDISVLEYILKNTGLNIVDIDDVLAEEKLTAEARTILMSYREKHFSQRQKSNKTEKDMGMREPTAAEVKKVWSVTKLDNGTLSIEKYKGNESDVIVPEHIGKMKIAEIGRGAFEGGKNIKSVFIPSSIRVLGDKAFKDCDNLYDITIPDSVVIIGNRTFESCASLRKITIPDSVTKIGYSAFEGCGNLKNVKLSENITTLSPRVFSRCYSLESIIIPDGVTEIKSEAFCGCHDLKSVNIPEGVSYIADGAFEVCTSLRNITVPENVNITGDNVFDRRTVILTPEGSPAEKYAKEKRRKFKNI